MTGPVEPLQIFRTSHLKITDFIRLLKQIFRQRIWFIFKNQNNRFKFGLISQYSNNLSISRLNNVKYLYRCQTTLNCLCRLRLY